MNKKIHPETEEDLQDTVALDIVDDTYTEGSSSGAGGSSLLSSVTGASNSLTGCKNP